MSAHHSPGDWSIKGPSAPTADSLEGGDYAIVAGGQIIAEVFYRSSPVHTHNAHANALLIAAAPVLLEALRDVLDTRNAEAKAAMVYTRAHENFSDAGRERVSHERAMYAACEAEKKARAVIAKATGDKA